MDVAYLNIAGTFYYLCSLLDGCSRPIVHREIREAMTEGDVEQIIQRTRERFPGAAPRIISDNGPQFVAKDFKEFIRICGMTRVKTSPYSPQGRDKAILAERDHKLEAARERRKHNRHTARQAVLDGQPANATT